MTPTGQRTIATSDGIALAAEVAGAGDPVVFLHEFSGDRRSWLPQVSKLRTHHLCVTFNARGYPPSQIPQTASAYSQARAADDVADVLHGIGIDRAHIVGLSMGGFAALHTAIRHPEIVSSLVIAGCGYGTQPSEQASYGAAMHREADHAEAIGMRAYAEEMGASPYARLLRAKDEQAWALFVKQLAEHSVAGMAKTLRGVLARRPSLWHIKEQLAEITRPVLLIIGDEDTPCLEPNLFLKRTLPDCGLCILPHTGHLPNLEEPELFNALVERFVASVVQGSWDHVRTSLA